MIRILKHILLIITIIGCAIVLYSRKKISDDFLSRRSKFYSKNGKQIQQNVTRLKNTIFKVNNKTNESIKSNSESLSSLNIIQHKRKSVNYLKGELNIENILYTIYLYRQDLISNFIIKKGTWEKLLADEVKKIAKLYRNRLQFLDIGCNVGVYTLVFASENIPGIAVDANPGNTDRTVQALLANNIGQNIKVLLNAVSDRRSTFSMNIYPPNIGGSRIYENKNSEVKSIFLDDLVNLLDKDLPIFMKIDIETHEVFALRKAHKLFASCNIEIVMMEWMWFIIEKKTNLATEVMHFFRSRGYQPHAGMNFDAPVLNWNQAMTWPTDVVFRRLKYLKYW